MRRLGHSLKGTARPYGFAHLESLGAELEIAATEGDVPRMKSLLVQIRDGLSTAVQAG